MKTRLVCMLVLGSVVGVQATPVTDWTIIFSNTEPNPGFASSSQGTASPVLNNADGESIAAQFAGGELADGQTITLSGSVTLDANLAGGQFRIGLFNGPDTLTEDTVPADNVGGGFTGIFTQAPVGASKDLDYEYGTDPKHPFQTGTDDNIHLVEDFLLADSDGVAGGTAIAFVLSIKRDGNNLDIASSYSDGGAYSVANTVTGLDIQSLVTGYDYTFDSAAFLFGTGQASGSATFSNIDVTVIPEPATLGMVALFGGGILFIRRRLMI